MSFIPISKADIDIIEKEKREVNRRRKAEQERKNYFFDDKKRKFGVDVNFIEKQIKYKQQTKENEIKADKEYRNQIDSWVDKLAIIDENRKNYYKNKAYQVGEHQKNTNIENCDTWDLNDPQMTTKDKPPRMTDNQLIPSCSLQKFNGEDLKINHRIKKQQKQLTKWCDEIVNEKNIKIKKEKESTLTYIKQRNEYLNFLQTVEKGKNEQAKERSVSCANAVILQRENKQNREQQCKQIDADKSEKEITTMLESTFLNETWDSTIRNNNKHRFIPYNFKGFSQNQKQQILNKQKEQIEENINYKQMTKQQDRKYYKQQQDYSRKALLQLRNVQRLQHERNNNLAEMRKTQIRNKLNVQKQEKHAIVTQTRKNGDYFLQQFQRSTR